MKPYYIIISLLFSANLYSQNISNKFRNAQLNLDYTSTFIVKNKENISSRKVEKWLKNNPAYFDKNYQFNVPVTGSKWFFGTDRKVISNFSFVKAEHIDKRAKYLAENATNYNQFVNVVSSYPQFESDFEQFGLNLITDIKNYTDFQKRYPNSNNLEIAFLNGFKTPYQNSSDDSKFYSILKKISPNNIESISSAQKRNIMDFVINQKRPLTKEDIVKLMKEFEYISSNESMFPILEYSWNLFRNNGIRGDILIQEMQKFETTANLINWEFPSANYTFLYDKLDYEVKNNVKVSNLNYISSANSEFDQWIKQAVTAGIVYDKDAAKFLFYGNVTNNSEFTLPVTITTEGLLKVIVKAEGNDALTRGAIKVYSFLEKLTGSKAIMDEARTMAKIQFTSDEYFLPSVMPGNSFNWAIMNDFSLITQKTGLNYADFIKVFNEFKMENYQAKVKFSPSKNLNSETLKKQDEWQKFAQFGLPTGQLYDYSRNQKVDFNFWEVKSEEKRERDRLWAERMRQQKIENANNSYVISSENAKVNLNVHLDENKSEIINIYTRDNDDKGCCYISRIYRYETNNPRGYLLKEFKNEKGFFGNTGESLDDNSVRITQSDFPVIVDIIYTNNNKNIGFSVLLTKGAELEVLPIK